jgi:lipopolysaccharide/colanic/teichoic acid biosynthesis glycosyltransferase
MYPLAKRTLDILLSTVGLMLLSPLLVVVGAAVRLGSRGPALYRGERIGLKGQPFRMYKFRSMVVDQEPGAAPVTYQGDPRITRMGAFLRRWKLDELPNLLNVLVGDMSLVGPRPESPALVARYTPEQREVLSVRPGIAGLTQIRFPNEESILRGGAYDQPSYLAHMAGKLELDRLYARNAYFWGDILILACTIFAIMGFQVDLEPRFHSRNARSARKPAQ